MKRFLFLMTILALAMAQLGALHFARWSTSMGVFTAELYDQLVPITANNFIDLVNSGFYNDLIFHRVIEGFVIQDGCPYGTGYGGPGYTIPDEFYPGLHHDQAGILAMARTTAPNSAGSQYYITLAPQPHLDGNYAIFGKVIQGLDTVLAIGSVPTNANGLPLTPVTIDTLRILDLAIGTITPPDTSLVQGYVNEPLMFIVEAITHIHTPQFAWFVDGVLQSGALDFIFETALAAAGAHTVECQVSNADWAHTVIWDVLIESSSAQESTPPPPSRLSVSPNPFDQGTRIRLYTDKPTGCAVSIYDLKGRLIRSSLSEIKAGYEWQWDGCDAYGNKLPAGIYLIRAELQNQTLIQKCMLY